MKRLSDARVWILLGLSIPLFFIGAGRLALIDPDEPFYAVPALEMLRSGTWQVPILHGAPWFDKPVFFYWVILGAFKLLGVTEFAARVGSGLAAVGGLFLVAAFGRGRDSARASLLGAIILATSLEYALLARAAVTDMTLTLFLTAGMLAVARYLESDRTWWMAIGGAAFGLAVLTKGPVGLVLPAVCLGAYLLFSRRTSLLRPRALGAGAAGALLTAAPWYLYMALAHRDLLVSTFLGEGNLGRFLNPEHQSSPFFYLVVLLLGMLPWSGALPGALFRAARPSSWKQERDHGATPGPLYALCWFGGILLVFSLSASKLLTYILPALPPAALMLGEYWMRALPLETPPSARISAEGRADPAGHRGGRLSASVGLVLVLLISLAALRGAVSGEWGIDRGALFLMAVVLSVGALAAWIGVMRSSLRLFVCAQTATTVSVILFGIFFAGPQLEPIRSAKGLVTKLRVQGLTEQVAGAYRERGFSLDFYLGKTLPRARGTRELESLVRANPGRLWVIPGGDVAVVTSDPRLNARPVALEPACSAFRLSYLPRAGDAVIEPPGLADPD